MDKFHLVITGRRNTGKSSIANTILQQDKAVVSPIAGTTTDPVKKSYEIPGVASVVLIDTAGTDDEGELGELRVKKTFETIRQADAALLVITGNRFGHFEEILTEEFQKLKLPFLIVHNKSDWNLYRSNFGKNSCKNTVPRLSVSPLARLKEKC